MSRYAYNILFLTPTGPAGQGGFTYEEPLILRGNSAFLIWSNLVSFDFTLNVNGVAYPFQRLNSGVRSGGIRIKEPNTLIGISTPAGEPKQPPTDARLVVANGPTLTLFYDVPEGQAPTSRWNFDLSLPPRQAGGTLQITGPTRQI